MHGTRANRRTQRRPLGPLLLAVGGLLATLPACTCASDDDASGDPTRSVGSDPAPAGPTAPPGEARTLPLAVDVPFAALDLPDHSRPHAPEPPLRIPLTDWTKGKGDTFVTRNPIRSRNLYFFKPSAGMRVVRADGTEIDHKYFRKPGAHWTYDADELRIHGWSEGVPTDEALFLEYPKATAREARLNQAFSGEDDPAAFARTAIQAGAESRSGLLLPAPGTAAFDLTVPPAAELRMSPGLVAPEVADAPPSDGATLTVSFTPTGGEAQTLWEGELTDDRFERVHVAMDALAGQEGRLTLSTDPGATPRFDYLFVADPVVMSRKADPQRVVLVFVDTLRPDHLSAYGYERDTSPALDALAQQGVRFDQARSVAPWTLPSARSVLTGQDPEFYFASDTLQGRLAAEGFATAMIAGNLYLGPNFGLNRDWGMHFVELLPMANDQVDRALSWLDAHEGRDAMMLVHLMDPHLPYKEPPAYRDRYAGEPPDKLRRPQFHRTHVLQARLRTPEERQYLRDRYDNNIRYADDQLARLYDRLDEDDIVVFFSDHGEEFWDHGAFEHGHTLFDEVLRVPLVVKGPGLPTMTAVDAPVSLLDVAPTVLDLLDLPHEGFKGRSLVPLAQGEAEAVQAFTERPQAFGRPLYGRERWGVLDGARKYSTVSGKELLYDLAADLGERDNLLSGDDHEGAAAMRSALGEALQREVSWAYSFSPRPSRAFPEDDLVATITLPGGVRAAWVGEDPTENSAAEVTVGEDGTVTATWPARFRGSRDVWVVPEGPLAETTPGITAQIRVGDATGALSVPDRKPAVPTGDGRAPLASARVGDRSLELRFGVAPLPTEDMERLSGVDDETIEQLKAMGYMVGEGE